MIVYVAVCVENTVLVHASVFAEKLSTDVTCEALAMTPPTPDPSSSPCIQSTFYEEYMFHYYILEEGICALCITTETKANQKKSKSPTEFLKDLLEHFVDKYGMEAPLDALAMTFNKEYSSVIRAKIIQHNNKKKGKSTKTQDSSPQEWTALLPRQQQHQQLNGEVMEVATSIDNPLELLVPDIHPLSWTAVNLMLLSCSIVVFWLVVATEEGVLGRPHGELIYLSWNFVSTACWCLEVGLVVWYHWGDSTWSDRIQLVAAVYFLVDSIRLFQTWHDPTSDMDEELLEILLNTVMYLWITLSTALQWRRQCQKKETAALAVQMENILV